MTEFQTASAQARELASQTGKVHTVIRGQLGWQVVEAKAASATKSKGEYWFTERAESGSLAGERQAETERRMNADRAWQDQPAPDEMSEYDIALGMQLNGDTLGKRMKHSRTFESRAAALQFGRTLAGKFSLKGSTVSWTTYNGK